MMTRQARRSRSDHRFDTHVILEAVPVLSSDAGTPISPSTGHHATFAEALELGGPAGAPLDPGKGRRRFARGCLLCSLHTGA
jgi:hypothetical protein